MRILVATSNPGKAAEFREMLADDSIEWSDLSSGGTVAAPEESGKTFRENASLKASYYAQVMKLWTLADDSGLAVDALDGKPGVHSARWAEMHGAGRGDAANNSLLLRQLEAVPDELRGARFVCALALSDPQGRIILTATDHVAGRILRQARGTNGFGYDPLFLIDELGKTTAELSSDHKHAISHRGRALRHLRGLLGRIGIPPRVA
jgi:XTP/dITP diphosphohydrolase